MIRNKLSTDNLSPLKNILAISSKIFRYPINGRIEFSNRSRHIYLKMTTIYFVFVIIFNITVIFPIYNPTKSKDNAFNYDSKVIGVLILYYYLVHLLLPFVSHNETPEIHKILINLKVLNKNLNCLINRKPLKSIIRLIIFIYIYFSVPLLLSIYRSTKYLLFITTFTLNIVLYHIQYIHFEIINIVIDTININLEVMLYRFNNRFYLRSDRDETVIYLKDVKMINDKVCRNLGRYILIFIIDYVQNILFYLYICYIFWEDAVRDYLSIVLLSGSFVNLFIIVWKCFDSHGVNHRVSNYA